MFTNETSLIIPTKNRSNQIIKLIYQLKKLNINFNELLILIVQMIIIQKKLSH